jgi:putative heme-binding domain-containing protein
LAREFNPPVFDALLQAAVPTARFPTLRGPALEACAARDPKRATPLLAQVLADAAEPANLRQQAATLLARVNDDTARRHLLDNLPTAPHRLAIEIAAGLADTRVGAQELLTAIETGKATPRLLQERVVVSRLQVRNLDHFADRLSKLTASLPPEDARLRELIEKRRELVTDGKPDLAKGAAVFEKHCAICHRIGDKGAKIGPNLDGVGIRGIDRLLEDILDPNRNVDQAFRATQVVADGRILTGLALRDEGQVLVLADSAGKEIRLPASDIEERTVSPLSPMPANVPDLMNEGEFVDLVRYLLNQREKSAATGS